jgi:hypothetical protein
MLNPFIRIKGYNHSDRKSRFCSRATLPSRAGLARSRPPTRIFPE